MQEIYRVDDCDGFTRPQVPIWPPPNWRLLAKNGAGNTPQSPRPGEWRGLGSGMADDGGRSDEKQRSEIPVSLFRDTAKALLAVRN